MPVYTTDTKDTAIIRTERQGFIQPKQLIIITNSQNKGRKQNWLLFVTALVPQTGMNLAFSLCLGTRVSRTHPVLSLFLEERDSPLTHKQPLWQSRHPALSLKATVVTRLVHTAHLQAGRGSWCKTHSRDTDRAVVPTAGEKWAEDSWS